MGAAGEGKVSITLGIMLWGACKVWTGSREVVGRSCGL